MNLTFTITEEDLKKSISLVSNVNPVSDDDWQFIRCNCLVSTSIKRCNSSIERVETTKCDIEICSLGKTWELNDYYQDLVDLILDFDEKDYDTIRDFIPISFVLRD